VRVHLAREHARELERLDPSCQRRRVAAELGEARLVLLRLDEVQQFEAVREALVEPGDLLDRRLETRAFATQLLSPLGRVPDLRILELAVYFFESLALAIVLKDTPSARRGAARGP